MKKYLVQGLLALCLAVFLLPGAMAVPICGDGVINGGEACDDGANNSDLRPNACRTDCRRAYCGDGVVDRGEQCDDSMGNFLDRPNGCRKDCTLPRCGDGVVDNGTRYSPNMTFTEQCDDGNRDNTDGCNTLCQKCEMLDRTGNLTLMADTEICSNVFRLDDDGDYGAITIKRNGVTLDCNGAELNGDGRGYGIYVYRARNVTIKNCRVRGFEVGIRLEDAANAALSNNQLCGNSKSDIELVQTPNGQGRNNACMNSGGWSDIGGHSGCTQQMASCSFSNLGAYRARKPPSPDQKSPDATDSQEDETKARPRVPSFLRQLIRQAPQ